MYVYIMYVYIMYITIYNHKKPDITPIYKKGSSIIKEKRLKCYLLLAYQKDC